MFAFKIVCAILLLIHVSWILYYEIFPTETFTRIEEIKLKDIEFPVYFKICLTPGFNITELRNVGYYNIWAYFVGQLRYTNEKKYGWGGYDKKNKTAISTPEGEFF